MKFNEKQLTIVFLIIFVLLLIGGYIFTQTAPAPVPPETKKHAVKPPPPLTKEDKALAEEVLSGKSAPLSKEDAVAAQRVLSPKNTLKPLSGAEEAAAKRIFGN